MKSVVFGLLFLFACKDKDPESDDSGDTNNVSDDTSDTDDSGVDAETVPLSGECSLEEDFGGFVVEEYDTSVNVAGSVSDGVVPITILEEIAASGECKLLRRNNPYCDPPCSSG